MVVAYMIPVYAFLVKAEKRLMDELPVPYQLPVAEYLVEEIEGTLAEQNE